MVVNQLRKWRLSLGYSQLELSVVAEISPVMIVSIERYGYLPGPDVRARIAAALNVSETTLWPDVIGISDGK